MRAALLKQPAAHRPPSKARCVGLSNFPSKRRTDRNQVYPRRQLFSRRRARASRHFGPRAAHIVRLGTISLIGQRGPPIIGEHGAQFQSRVTVSARNATKATILLCGPAIMILPRDLCLMAERFSMCSLARLLSR
jgi:hypothetical protein